MDIVVSDFDDTLFKRNVGLIYPVVSYLKLKRVPLYVVTYRMEGQEGFIMETLQHGGLRVFGIGFAESRKKEPAKKLAIVKQISRYHNVVEALDNQPEVLVQYKTAGLKVKHPADIYNGVWENR